MPKNQSPLPLVGASACLLGYPVRYDGRDKGEPELLDILANHVELLPICPETGIGLGVPRPPIRLVGDARKPRARGIADPSLDVTTQLEKYAHQELLNNPHLCGFLLKKNSPSCGLHDVGVFEPESDKSVGESSGIFARTIEETAPLLPLIDEEALADAQNREAFIRQVYDYHRRYRKQQHKQDQL